MSNNVTKDPTFRHFILGLVVFVIIIVVGVFGIRSLFNESDKIAKNDQADQSEVIIEDVENPEILDNQTSQSEEQANQLTKSKEQSASTVDQITKVGNQSVFVKAAILMITSYIAVFVGQKLK